jgi:hypothetical protein
MSRFVDLTPNSVTDLDGAKALLTNYLAKGCNSDLWYVAVALSPAFGAFRSVLLNLWQDWAYEGGESDQGLYDRGLGYRVIKHALSVS